MRGVMRMVVGGLVAVGLSGCGWLAKKVYPDLERRAENEMPPSFTAYRPSAATLVVLGGRGEGLSCSIPALVKPFAFSRGRGEAPVDLQFRQACVMHDFCYRHGYATYGYTQAHCDFALQADAFLLCRQIYKTKKSSEECEDEARKVLLGVRVGGGPSKSFRGRGVSTYFEYDPMPERADDYVVARALQGELLSFHFKRSQVSARRLLSDPADKTGPDAFGPVVFPERFIATPPLVVGVGEGERLRALARDGYGNTGWLPVDYDRSHGKPKPPFSFKIQKSPLAFKSHQAIDKDFSAATLAGEQVVGLSHRAGEENRPAFKRCTVGTEGCDKSVTLPDSSTQDQSKYRWLVSGPALELDQDGQPAAYLAQARGFRLKGGQPAAVPDGTGFGDTLMLARWGANAREAPTFRLFRAQEADEPLFPITVGAHRYLVGLRKQGEGLSRLMAWRYPESSSAAEPEVVSVVDEGAEPTARPLGGAADIPPVIARGRDGNVYLVQAQVTEVAGVALPYAAGFDRSNDLQLKFTIHQLSANSGGKLSSTRVRSESYGITLDRQIEHPGVKVLRVRAGRAIDCVQGGECYDNNVPGDPYDDTFPGDAFKTMKAKSLADWSSWLKQDLAERWRMSQLLVDAGPADGELLRVHLVFNGFPGSSVSLAIPQDSGPMPKVLLGDQFVDPVNCIEGA